ncbi:MAG: antibiotic biosynthesis monooxygenase [Solirubrobacterales bacterium]|jgi:quinol monooxygenase YgiN/mannose-6-phosphate isomerase-like protein (cupin superfamily)
MASVGRYAKATAKPGRGDELARVMLEVASSLQNTPGCELYVVNRDAADPDVVWVTEIWRSQEALDASLEAEGAQEQIARVRDLVRGFERIDVEPLGGVGHPPADAGFTALNLEEVEDQATKFGYGEMGEARFANRALGAVQTGVSHQRIRPNRRQAFAHRHHRAEEVYVVLAGSGRARIDDEIVDLGPATQSG